MFSRCTSTPAPAATPASPRFTSTIVNSSYQPCAASTPAAWRVRSCVSATTGPAVAATSTAATITPSGSWPLATYASAVPNASGSNAYWIAMLPAPSISDVAAPSATEARAACVNPGARPCAAPNCSVCVPRLGVAAMWPGIAAAGVPAGTGLAPTRQPANTTRAVAGSRLDSRAFSSALVSAALLSMSRLSLWCVTCSLATVPRARAGQLDAARLAVAGDHRLRDAVRAGRVRLAVRRRDRRDRGRDVGDVRLALEHQDVVGRVQDEVLEQRQALLERALVVAGVEDEVGRPGAGDVGEVSDELGEHWDREPVQVADATEQRGEGRDAGPVEQVEHALKLQAAGGRRGRVATLQMRRVGRPVAADGRDQRVRADLRELELGDREPQHGGRDGGLELQQGLAQPDALRHRVRRRADDSHGVAAEWQARPKASRLIQSPAVAPRNSARRRSPTPASTCAPCVVRRNSAHRASRSASRSDRWRNQSACARVELTNSARVMPRLAGVPSPNSSSLLRRFNPVVATG